MAKSFFAGRAGTPGSRLTITMAGLFLAAILPYLASGISPFFIDLDDPDYILENSAIRKGLTLAGARWALTSFHAMNWHPLTWLSHMADVSLFGLDARWHHLTGILVHGLTASLLFLALLRLTGAVRASVFVAAIFGVHPLRVESVAWAAERKDVLSGLFFMLVLLAYERYARKHGGGRYLLVALLLALGLMTKPMLVTVPGVLLLLDFWPLGRLGPGWNAQAGPTISRARVLAEKLPLLALAAAAAALTWYAQRAGNAVAELQALPVAARLANAAVSYVAYVGKTIWPTALAVYYPHQLGDIAWWRVSGATTLLIGISVAALFGLRRFPAFAVGWFWYLGMLLPVIGLVQVGQQAMADRYTYLPTVGLLMGAAWVAPVLVRPGRRHVAALWLCGGGVLAALTMASIAQAHRWRDSESLFRHALAVTSDNWLAHLNLGSYLERNNRVEEAIAEYRGALLIKPTEAVAHAALGSALYRQGRLKEAESSLRLALQLRPEYPEVLNNLGNILDEFGRKDEAMVLYRTALRIRPDDHVARNNLGVSLEEQGRLDEALAYYQQALRQRPDYPEALYNMARALTAAGKRAEAIGYLRNFLRQRPDFDPARRQLGELLRPSTGAKPGRQSE